MRILLALVVLSAGLGVAFAQYSVDRAVHPPCTCGPRCPTPTAKSWPIPASMEKLR